MYVKKNKQAPDGQRYCNGYCQEYRLSSEFAMNNSSPLTVCKTCENLIDIAMFRVENGDHSADEIRKDPTILNMKPDEMMCRKCKKILHKSQFPEKRKQCKQCRNKNRSQYGKNFDNVLGEEIAILNNLGQSERIEKLEKYTKVEIQKIAHALGLGRRASDNKETTKDKVISYYRVPSQIIKI
jgi:hypothetical protein